MFEKILIFGQGEPAVRVARTCQRIGSDTVTITTESEKNDPLPQSCDLVHVEATADFRTDHRRVFEIAKMLGCDAIHPSYDGVEQDLSFARYGELYQIPVIGPTVETLVLIRDRQTLFEVAHDLGVRVRPLTSKAATEDDDEPSETIARSRFGIGSRELGERDFVQATSARERRVDVYVVRDKMGQVAVLGDVEASVGQVGRASVFESPAPAIDQLFRGEAVRSAIWQATVDLAEFLDLQGVLVFQFAIDAAGTFFFDGLVPTLCGEHSTVELCTNTDIVEAQVRIAAGELLPPEFLHSEPSGHAVGARIEASMDPNTGMPFSSRVEDFRWPPAPAGRIRVEAGVHQGSKVAPLHTPLLGTMTAHAPTRHEAVLLLDRVIAETRLVPVVTNLRWLRNVLNHESFRAGIYDVDFVKRLQTTSFSVPPKSAEL